MQEGFSKEKKISLEEILKLYANEENLRRYFLKDLRWYLLLNGLRIFREELNPQQRGKIQVESLFDLLLDFIKKSSEPYFSGLLRTMKLDKSLLIAKALNGDWIFHLEAYQDEEVYPGKKNIFEVIELLNLIYGSLSTSLFLEMMNSNLSNEQIGRFIEALEALGGYIEELESYEDERIIWPKYIELTPDNFFEGLEKSFKQSPPNIYYLLGLPYFDFLKTKREVEQLSLKIINDLKNRIIFSESSEESIKELEEKIRKICLEGLRKIESKVSIPDGKIISLVESYYLGTELMREENNDLKNKFLNFLEKKQIIDLIESYINFLIEEIKEYLIFEENNQNEILSFLEKLYKSFWEVLKNQENTRKIFYNIIKEVSEKLENFQTRFGITLEENKIRLIKLLTMFLIFFQRFKEKNEDLIEELTNLAENLRKKIDSPGKYLQSPIRDDELNIVLNERAVIWGEISFVNSEFYKRLIDFAREILHINVENSNEIRVIKLTYGNIKTFDFYVFLRSEEILFVIIDPQRDITHIHPTGPLSLKAQNFLNRKSIEEVINQKRFGILDFKNRRIWYLDQNNQLNQFFYNLN